MSKAKKARPAKAGARGADAPPPIFEGSMKPTMAREFYEHIIDHVCEPSASILPKTLLEQLRTRWTAKLDRAIAEGNLEADEIEPPLEPLPAKRKGGAASAASAAAVLERPRPGTLPVPTAPMTLPPGVAAMPAGDALAALPLALQRPVGSQFAKQTSPAPPLPTPKVEWGAPQRGIESPEWMQSFKTEPKKEPTIPQLDGGGDAHVIPQLDGGDDDDMDDDDDDEFEDEFIVRPQGDSPAEPSDRRVKQKLDEEQEQHPKPAEVPLADEEELEELGVESEEDRGDGEHIKNLVLCQYDKVTKQKRKWKLNFKAGIMRLNGRQYIFEKLSGDLQWEY